MQRIVTRAWVMAASLALPCGLADAQSAAPQISRIVTFDPDGPGGRPPTARALTAAELKLARERAIAFYAAVAATAPWKEPQNRSKLVASWAVVGFRRAVEQSFTVYWSATNDVRLRADGALTPKLGGAHDVFYFITNEIPATNRLEDRATRDNFGRDSGRYGLTFDAFAMPRVLGEIGGGTIYVDMIVFTRDGRSALEPAPLGPLLAFEVQRLRKSVTDLEEGFAGSLRELEVTMTPQAIVERRAKREERWKTETRDPVALAKRLDAGHRTDAVDYERQKERMTAPTSRDPKSVWWGARLALEVVESRLAKLDAAGRNAPACGRVDSTYLSGADVRFEPNDGAPSGCVPMVRIRQDLLTPQRPTSEVQLFTVWFGESVCGTWLATGAAPQRGRCEEVNPLLRALDWTAVRQAVGW